MFQHTAARRRLDWFASVFRKVAMFQHTAARRRLGAGRKHHHHAAPCFNTQPPEGGWPRTKKAWSLPVVFQHTAARRRLAASRFSRLVSSLGFQHTAARRRLD